MLSISPVVSILCLIFNPRDREVASHGVKTWGYSLLMLSLLLLLFSRPPRLHIVAIVYIFSLL